MKRRDFIDYFGLLGAGVVLTPLFIAGCQGGNEPRKEEPDRDKSWLDKLLGENDLAVSQLLDKQVEDALNHNYGGLPDDYQIFHPGSAAGFIQRLTVSYISENSAYFHLDHLVVRMEHTLEFLLKRQHEDGTIDLLTTNFHSTPDTGFVVEPLALSYKLLLRDNQAATQKLRASMEEFLQQAGEALKVGGIHTPNHRWVVSMAMSRLHELFPDQGYVQRIDQWLSEGIDIDSDGQYTERSTAVYSPLTDRCLITMARLLNRPHLLDPVRRNLDMTLNYIHPNGEIATEASRRQDQYLARTPLAYYYPYRFMSVKEPNAEFGAMVQLLEANLGATGLSNFLPYLIEDPEIATDYPVGQIPDDYALFFKDSSLVRIRRGNYDATILGSNSALFTMHNQNAVIQAVRMASAFFGKGQFIADAIIQDGDQYILTQKLEGPYYQPIDKELIAADGNWEKMPREKRPKSEIQTIEYRLEIKEVQEGFQLDFVSEGTDNVPVTIEISMRKGGKIEGGEHIEDVPDAYFLAQEKLTYRMEESGIEISGALKQHAWTQLRGAEPRIEGTTLYLTGFTPFRHQIIFKVI